MTTGTPAASHLDVMVLPPPSLIPGRQTEQTIR